MNWFETNAGTVWICYSIWNSKEYALNDPFLEGLGRNKNKLCLFSTTIVFLLVLIIQTLNDSKTKTSLFGW